MTARKRVAVYNLYWSTYGGGEQTAGAIAQALADDHDVTLLGPEPIDIKATIARLGIDLSGCAYQHADDDVSASVASGSYDLFINNTYRSSAKNNAPIGLYYVLFPGPRGTPRERVSRGIARGLASVIRHVKVGPLKHVYVGLERRTARTKWAESYTTFLSDSAFTALWVKRLWKVPSEVLYPPVRPEVLAGVKMPTIVSLGRFFDPKYGHCKKQLDLLHAFIELEQHGADGWRLELIGGADGNSRDYALAVRRGARGHAVGVHFIHAALKSGREGGWVDAAYQAPGG